MDKIIHDPTMAYVYLQLVPCKLYVYSKTVCSTVVPACLNFCEGLRLLFRWALPGGIKVALRFNADPMCESRAPVPLCVLARAILVAP